MKEAQFELHILSPDKGKHYEEFLIPPMGNGKKLSLFGLINTLVAYWPGAHCSYEEEYDTLCQITEILRLKEGVPAPYEGDDEDYREGDKEVNQHLRKSHFEKPVYSGRDEIEDDNPLAPDEISFSEELRLLVQAARIWLNAKNSYDPIPMERFKSSSVNYYGDNPFIKPAVRFTQAGRQDINTWLMHDVFNRRIKQTSTRLYMGEWQDKTIRSIEDSYDKDNKKIKYIREYPIFSEIHSANSILPLAWMELLHSVKNQVYAKVCVNCGCLFPITDKRQLAKEFCSRVCNNEFHNKSVELKEIEKKRGNCRRNLLTARRSGNEENLKKYTDENSRLVGLGKNLREQLKKPQVFFGIPW